MKNEPKMDNSQKTKKDQIIATIREAILSGEFVAGERLLQEDLAERFNTSPTPIREALRQLEAEGILEHSPYRGVQVAEVKLEDVKEIYMIRSVLEMLATRVAVPYLNSAYLERLDGLQREMETLAQAGEFALLRKPNYDFHMTIYEAAGMPQLLQMIKTLWTKFPWDTLHVLPGRANASLEEHRRILAAIRDEDPKLAGQLVQQHIEQGALSLNNFMQKRP